MALLGILMKSDVPGAKLEHAADCDNLSMHCRCWDDGCSVYSHETTGNKATVIDICPRMLIVMLIIETGIWGHTHI